MLVLAGALAYGGFACLALSQRRHWLVVAGAAAPEPRGGALRALGTALVVGSLWAALRHEAGELGFGLTLWGMGMSVAGYLVVATLTWRPRWLRPIARAVGWAPRERRRSRTRAHHEPPHRVGALAMTPLADVCPRTPVDEPRLP